VTAVSTKALQNRKEYDMTYNLKVVFLGFASLLASSSMLSSARADEWNKKTVVTFNVPVEVPGTVLAEGTYVFKLADSQADREIVQIFTEDERELITTTLALPAYRLEPTGDTVITFEERPSGSPEAVKKWFYPGDNYGFEFMYPK
jgi:hypothetical protein